MHIETTLVILFAIATAVAITARRVGIPYTVALVLAGLGLGSLHIIAPPQLTKELLFTIFLPGLLFEAAFHIDITDFWRNRVAITALAVPGVIAAIVLTGLGVTAAIHALGAAPGFTLEHGLVFGALVAATDPIAVVALFKSLRVPSRLGTLIEGESLLNDGTSVVIFSLLLAYVMGATSSVMSLVTDFIHVAGGGLVAGLIVGFVTSHIIARIDDAMLEITVTMIAAYGSFVLAEQFGVSGVISTVVAGMFCGSHGRRTGMSPTTRLAVVTFWEYLAFALNTVVFLLIGFTVRLPSLGHAGLEIGVAFLAVLLARASVIGLTAAALRRTREDIPVAWNVVLAWGGLRGALSMVLALSVPPEFPYRELLLTLTFGVVLLSILIQGMSMRWVLTRLGIGHGRGAGALI